MNPPRRMAQRLQPTLGGVLYVEGARDRDILEGWARSVSNELAQRLRMATIILGGRQPSRALAHATELRRREPELRALCVLDGDGGDRSDAARDAEVLAGELELFTWTRRHIESYLLVPSAISRMLRLPPHDLRLARLLRDHLPAFGDEKSFRALDAKRLLGPTGPFARTFGRPLALGRIARGTAPADFHEDVSALLARLTAVLGSTPDALGDSRVRND